MRACFLILTSLASIAGCASTRSGSRSPVPWLTHDGSFISEADIVRVGASTAHEAIQMLRPMYLSAGRGATVERAVYLDGVRIGGLEVLRGIQSSTIREIRWLDSLAATTRFGSGYPAGAILIATKSGR